MSEDFDWQTGDGLSWDEDGRPDGEKRGQPAWRVNPILILTLLALALAGAAVYWAMDRRVKETTAAAEANVLIVHDLVRLANTQHDVELLHTVLDDSAGEWAEIQDELVRSGSLFDWPNLGFRHQDTPPGSDQVKLSPGLTSAEVTFLQTYTVQIGRQHTETIRLQQIAYYQLDDGRWLLARPPRSFWGNEITHLARRLALTYPERDREVALRLALDLDHLLEEACLTFPDLHCPAGLQVRLTLETGARPSPETPASVSEPRDSLELSLPAPTLPGVPVDDAGYQILAQRYGAELMESVIGELAGYRCCNHHLFYQALLDQHLDQLGLQSYTYDSDLYNALAGSLTTLSDIGSYWPVEGLAAPIFAARSVDALVNFLARERDLPLTPLLQELSDPAIQGYWVWLAQAANEAGSRQSLEKAWLAYVQANSTAKLETAPPQEDQYLQLLCQLNGSQQVFLYRYEPGEGLLVREIPLGVEGAFMAGLPDDSGVVVGELSTGRPEESTRLFIWRQGQEIPVLESHDSLLPLDFPQVEPAGGDQLLLFNTRSRQYGLLALDDCLEKDGCEADVLLGYPLWAPDGQMFLMLIAMSSYGYESRFERPLILGGVSSEIMGSGKGAIWLKGDTIAYIDSSGRNVLTVGVVDLIQQRLLSTYDLAASLPGRDEQVLASFTLEYIAVDPDYSDLLLVVAADSQSQATALFTYDRRTGWVMPRAWLDLTLDPTVPYNYQFSPDRQWLTVSGYNHMTTEATQFFFDRKTGRSQSYHFGGNYSLPMHWYMDWSAGGRWLSIIDSGYVRLFAPEAGYQQLFIPDGALCTSAVWVNKTLN